MPKVFETTLEINLPCVDSVIAAPCSTLPVHSLTLA